MKPNLPLQCSRDDTASLFPKVVVGGLLSKIDAKAYLGSRLVQHTAKSFFFQDKP